MKNCIAGLSASLTVQRFRLTATAVVLFGFCLAGAGFADRAAVQSVSPTPAPFPNGKYGGVLQAVTRENPPSLSIIDEVSISVVWPVMPLYSNLVLYDPFRPVEDGEHLIGELAESWAWSDGGRRLNFTLRRGVKWHDGKPFTSADVKYTFDLVRDLPQKRLRLNPRKALWENIKDVVPNGDYQVAFVLGQPQPGLLSLLASGFSAIYPAHVEPAELRGRAVGTGPFRLKEYTPDERIVLEKNPDYFVKGRPYLDGIQYTVIRVRPSRMAALKAGQVYVSFPNDGTLPAWEEVHGAAPSVLVHEVATGVPEQVLLNRASPPFNNPKLALAANLALDRPSAVRSVHQGVGVLGGAILPPPYGPWGLPAEELARLPGYGDVEKNRERARKLLAEEGYGPGHPLVITFSTRAVENYVDLAAWVMAQFKEVGIEGKLEQIDSAAWIPKVIRGDYQVGPNLGGVATDDPDGTLFDAYTCGSRRNYTHYCDPETDELIRRQSLELDRPKRVALVHEIDRRLQRESARPILLHRVDHFMQWPFVKNLVPHHNIYSYGRMQDVWLDK
jgi:peptide/nickel transport system substrate-binding protein